jgi:hypothetical protein
MSHIEDGWVTVNTATGEITGSGTGRCEPAPGETLMLKPVVADDDHFSAHRRWESSRDVLLALANDQRNFADKYKCAVAYLDGLSPSVNTLAQQEAALDAVAHMELYDEYHATKDVMTMTPVELAQAIVANHMADNAADRARRSQAEAAHRRAKLLAEQVALTPPVVGP